jgi:5,5'-dehydrodivanillate O-demethylase oxygenase subunit
MARVEDGLDPDVAFTREPHDRIELPCEKNKFGAGLDFALAWLAMGSSRYSPEVDTVRKIHLDAAHARGEKVPEEVES